MKRQLSILACLALVIALAFSLASCDLVNKVLGKDTETECTEHTYVDGKCECGATDPNYVPPHVHNFVEGKCECGASDPNYVAPADGTAANPYALTVPGTLDVNFAGGMNPIWYVFTAAESKTLSITLGSSNACMAYGVNINDVVYTEEGQTNVKVNLTAGTTYYVGFCSQDYEAAQYTVTAEYVVSPYERVLHAGNNTVVFSAAEVKADAASRKLVIDEAANYKFASGNLFVSSVIDANGNAIAKNDDYTYTLAAGEYTVNFSMLSMFGVAADADCTLNVENPNAEDEGDDPIITPPVGPTGPLDTDNSTLVIGENTITITDADIENGSIQYTIVVTAAGTFTVSSNDLGANFLDAENAWIGNGIVDLEIGTYTVAVLCGAVETAGDYTITLSYEAPSIGGGDEEGDGDDNQEGSESNPVAITLPAENLATNGDSFGYVWYTFTATESGIITVTYSNENTMVKMYNVADEEDSNFKYGSQTITMKVKANTTYNLGLGVWDPDEGVTASVTFEAVEEGALADKGSMELDKATTFEVTDADITAGGFTANLYSVDAGEYSITSDDLMISSVTTEDGTVIARNDNYRYELEAYTQYIVTFSTQYVSNAGSYSATVKYNYPEGHQKNPIWIYGLGDSVTATYKGDYLEVWYQFYANANGVVTITTENTSAIIMIKPEGVMENINNMVEGEWTGSVSLNVMQGRKYLIAVCDYTYGEEELEIVFTPALTEGEYVGDGSAFTPSIMTNDTTSAYTVGWDNTYFVYTAATNGTLTLTTENANCSWAIATEFGNWEFVEGGSISIALEMDDKAYIAIATADYTEATIDFTVSFKADPTSVWFDGPVNSEGTAANEVVVAENTWVTLSFWGMGQYQITWDNVDAIVAIAGWPNNTVIANGEVITGSNWGTDVVVYINGYAAGTVNVTITPYVEESSSNSLVIGDNTISASGTEPTVVEFTATEAGMYAIVPGSNAVVEYDYTTYFAGETLNVYLEANQTVSFNVYTADRSSADVDVNIAEAQVSVPGEYRYVDSDSWQHRWVLILNEDGTGTIAEQNYDSSSFAWSVVSSDTLTYTSAANDANGYDITVDFASGAVATDGTYSVSFTGISSVALGDATVDFTLYEG